MTSEADRNWITLLLKHATTLCAARPVTQSSGAVTALTRESSILRQLATTLVFLIFLWIRNISEKIEIWWRSRRKSAAAGRKRKKGRDVKLQRPEPPSATGFSSEQPWVAVTCSYHPCRENDEVRESMSGRELDGHA